MAMANLVDRFRTHLHTTRLLRLPLVSKCHRSASVLSPPISRLRPQQVRLSSTTGSATRGLSSSPTRQTSHPYAYIYLSDSPSASAESLTLTHSGFRFSRSARLNLGRLLVVPPTLLPAASRSLVSLRTTSIRTRHGSMTSTRSARKLAQLTSSSPSYVPITSTTQKNFTYARLIDRRSRSSCLYHLRHVGCR